MRAINKQVIILYTLVITYVVAELLSLKFKMFSINNSANLFIWIVMFFFAFLIARKNYRRYLHKSDKFQTTFIVVITYLSLYFTLGIFFGYQHNVYSMTAKGIVTNTLLFMPIIIFQEYIRQVLIEYSGNNKKLLILITILFILVTLNYSSLLNNFRSSEAAFKYICSDIIPTIAMNVLFTYLTYISGYTSAAVYRILTTAIALYLPILPNLDWFFTGLSGILVPAILFAIINYSHMMLIKNQTKKEEKSNRPSTYIPVFAFIFCVVAFVIGMFKYMPLAVVSNSMFPLFERGDVAIIEQIDKTEINKIKEGTIVKYQANGYYVIHRVKKIEETEDGLLFTTKGDNNNAEDSEKVKEEQIKGIYKFKIKYIGYPSVWLSEALK